MGFSLTKKFDPLRKVHKKLLGRNDRFLQFGYWKKKTGLQKTLRGLYGANNSAASVSSDIYGPTGSIVGRF